MGLMSAGSREEDGIGWTSVTEHKTERMHELTKLSTLVDSMTAHRYDNNTR